MTEDHERHFRRHPRRKAEFIRPQNILKAKAGSGGLAEDILDKAQALLEKNTVDFLPLGEIYLSSLIKAIDEARTAPSGAQEEYLANIIYPSIQLKSGGGMFHFQLITRVADKLIQFLEVIENLDEESIEIASAYHSTMRAILLGRIRGDESVQAQELMQALNDACERYFEKKAYPVRATNFNYVFEE